METVEQQAVSEPIQQVIFKGDVGQIFREVVDELKSLKKSSAWPDHAVAQGAVVASAGDDLIKACQIYKYKKAAHGSKEYEEQLKQMETAAIKTAANAIRFIESLRK